MIDELPGLEPARVLDPCRRPEGSWVLGTRMGGEIDLEYCAYLRKNSGYAPECNLLKVDQANAC